MINLKQGDCLELLKGLPDNSIDLVLTDPPYGTTLCKWDCTIPFEPMWEQLNRVIKEDGVILLFGSEPFASLLRTSNLKMYKYDWYWNKPHTGQLNAKKLPLKNIETISVFYNKNKYNPQFTQEKPYIIKRDNYKGSECYSKQRPHTTVSDGKRYPMQLLKYNHDKNRVHPTQKPVELLEYLIKTYSNENDTVLDFTMGSGSTGVACVNTNRNFIGFELDKNYYDIAEKRINDGIIFLSNKTKDINYD